MTALDQALMRRTSTSRTRFPLQLQDPVPPPSVCADCAGGSPAAALPSEEFEGFLDELCMELEDAAVASVGVGHQFTVRQAAGQVG